MPLAPTFGPLKPHEGNRLSDSLDFRTILYKNEPFLYKNEPFKAGFVFSFDNTKYNRIDMILNEIIILDLSGKPEVLKSAVAIALKKQHEAMITIVQTIRHLAQTLNRQPAFTPPALTYERRCNDTLEEPFNHS